MIPRQERIARVETKMSGLRVTRDNNGQLFEVRRGDVVEIRLEENATTGYEWELGSVDGEVLALERDEFVPPGDMAFGAPGMREVYLRAKTAGSALVRFKYRRQWESEAAAEDRFGVTISVKD